MVVKKRPFNGKSKIIQSGIAKMRDRGISDEVICAVHRPSGWSNWPNL
jgi:hypothetical protein